MKRDDDDLRQLLFEFEAKDDWLVLISGRISADRELRKREYHIELLCDEGLMSQISESGYRMTSQGHDYLDAIRSDTVWKRTKKVTAEVGGATLGMMKDIAIELLKQAVFEKTGLKI